MFPLRGLSARPTLVVDARGFRIVDPATVTSLGREGPFGRGRIVPALPLNAGPVQLRPPEVIQGVDVSYVGDPSGNLVGREGVGVARMLTATPTENTRRPF
jgi:hypothetical protein